MSKQIFLKRDPIDKLWRPVSEEAKANLIDSVDKDQRKKARKTIEQLGDKLKLTEDGRIVYPTRPDTIGSAFLDIINWYTDSTNYPAPIDKQLFLRLLGTDHFPENTLIKLPPKWEKIYKST